MAASLILLDYKVNINQTNLTAISELTHLQSWIPRLRWEKVQRQEKTYYWSQKLTKRIEVQKKSWRIIFKFWVSDLCHSSEFDSGIEKKIQSTSVLQEGEIQHHQETKISRDSEPWIGTMAGMEREWKNGVFGCFSNMGNCCYAYFCPCCAVGKVAERVGDSCCMCCLLSWCVSPLISICIVRGKVRSAYGIQVCNTTHQLHFT